MILSPKLNEKYIFSRIAYSDVYMMELPGLGLKQAICSPLREDRSPSMYLTIGESGQMRHKDLAYPDDNRYSGGAVDFVMSRYGLSFIDALKKIAQDFHLLDGNDKYKEVVRKQLKPVMDMRRSSFIQVTVRKWEKRDVEYWNQFGISKEQLKEESVYPLREAYMNRSSLMTVEQSRIELGYCYRYPNGYKLYFPGRPKGEKWWCNITNDTIEGLEKLNGQEKVIITKSKKDRLCLLNCLNEYHIGVLSVQNENKSGFTKELIERIKDKVVYIGFDCDSPGREASNKITREFGYLHVNVPNRYWEEEKIKDWADLHKVYGKGIILEHFNKKKII